MNMIKWLLQPHLLIKTSAKKCQFFCLELQLKYLHFCMKSDDVQQQLTYLDQQALRYDNEDYYDHLCDQDK